MFRAIFSSFRRIPLWVQFWVAFILVPVNLASLFFLGDHMGILIATLAIGGMVPNIFIMAYERGMSKLMALPHVVVWTPLCILVLWLLYKNYAGSLELGSPYTFFLIILLIINTVSLMFDFPDIWKWYSGDRAIA